MTTKPAILGNYGLRRGLLMGAVLSSYMSATAATGRTEVKLRPVAPSPEQVGMIGGPGAWGLSFGVQSLLPFSNPFKSTDFTPAEKFRYQTNTGYDLELSLGFSDSLEVAVLAGFASYGARSNYDEGQFETVTLRQWPIEGIVRYRQPVPGWAAEAEVGLGLSFGSFTSVSSNQSTVAIDESVTALRGHVAIGVGYPWSDYVSIHLRTGYGFEGVGSKEYPDSNIARSNFSGLHLKGGLRANF